MKCKIVRTVMAVSILSAVCFGSVDVMAKDMTITDPEVEKVMEVADGVTLPDSTFEYTVTKVTADGPDIHIENISFVEGTENDENNLIYGYGNILNSNNKQLSVSDFTHAGIYEYTITEVDSGDQSADINNDMWSYDTISYDLFVHVVNTELEGLEISQYVIRNSEETDTKYPSITFNNVYTKTTDLTIEKQVDGDFADRTKDFDFTITMIAPSTAESNMIFTGYIGEEVVSVTSGVQQTFKLHDNEKLVFEDIPAGTEFVVSEVGSADTYMASVTVEENGVRSEYSAERDEDGIASNGTSDEYNIAGENNNYVVFLNTCETTPVTGIITDNLPFIVIGVAIIGGICIYAVVKRKLAK